MKVENTNATQTFPEWPDRVVGSWRELQDAFDELRNGGCIFRGQECCQWPLLSSFNRLVPCGNEAAALNFEWNSIVRFFSEAHSYLPPTVIPPNHFKLTALDTYVEWLMIMQHYGAPTRLLDWSQSPYVAAYFAVIDCGDDDGAIWYFDSVPVEEKVYARFVRNPGTFLDYADFSSEEIRRPGDAPLLLTAKKKMRTAREVAQQGVFAFTNRLNANQQSIIPKICADQPFGRIIIPQRLKVEFCRRLAQMNVTAAALFPGVEGVCTAIRDEMRQLFPKKD